MIPKMALLAMLIEIVLILFSVVLLVQPRAVATMSGMFLLCVTFCWSVIFGCILAVREMMIRF